MIAMQEHAKAKPNRLIHEKSPYLLQHAYNPVDWYPWSKEAFQRALQEDKPILLSIGYSTCHWCHVMERESFSDGEVARLMNDNFICIKLDREERPDLDQFYITAVSAIRGSAGWPLNVFLTPDLKPFYGGTYFPPQRRPGMASWTDILQFLSKAWQDPDQRQKVLNSAGELIRMIREHLEGRPESAPMEAGLLEAACRGLEARFDPVMGGFSPAPKFPSPSIQAFLFFYAWFARRTGGSGDAARADKAREMALHTLKHMARGGIFDQIGGGFHRYSTDGRWHVPHFEKMLYDNAQLTLNYLTAFQLTQDPFFREIVEKTLTYIEREMTHPEGGFFSAQDADSFPARPVSMQGIAEAGEKREGAYYVWKVSEIVDLLGETDAGIVAFRYGMHPAGNAREDPYGEFTGENILHAEKSLEETARHFGISEDSILSRLKAIRTRLLAVRESRPKPHLDDKIITAWNGLMISAFAKAHQVLRKASYLDRAVTAAEFIWTRLYDEKNKILYRIWREKDRRIPGLAEDYAAFIQGLLDTYEAGFDDKWLHRADTLAQVLIHSFYDREHGGFFVNAASPEEAQIPRIKEAQDSVIPSAATLATLALLRLNRFVNRGEYLEAAEATVRSFTPLIRRHPESAPLMLTAMGYLTGESPRIVFAGNPEEEKTQRLLEAARAHPFPLGNLILVDGEARRESLSKILPSLASMPVTAGKPTAYFCKNQTCSEPMTETADLIAALKKISSAKSTP